MSRRSPRVDAPSPALLLSPLIDVVFLLLVFIVLVARFVDREQLELTLPTSSEGTMATAGPVVVTLAPDGRVLVDLRDVPPDELAQVLADARGVHTAVVVVAEPDTDLQRAVDAITAAKRAGYRTVAVATQPR